VKPTSTRKKTNVYLKKGSYGSVRSTFILHSWKQSHDSEALPEDDLRPVLLVFFPTDPRGAEGGQVGEHRAAAPHREVSVLRAGDADARPRVGGDEASDFSLEALGQARQQSVPPYR